MARKQQLPRFSPKHFFEKVGKGKTLLTSLKKDILFSQGDSTEAIFYIQKGQVKLSVESHQGKEAVVAMLGPGVFLGEGCLAGQLVCMATATTTEDSTLVRIEKRAMIDALHNEPTFAERFLTYLLSRNIRIQEDLVDQLFNWSEKRLARVLLLMAHFGKEGKSEAIIPKFRKLGFVEYNGGVHMHSSLLNIVLHD